jgi:hypothetical protein
MLGDNCRYQILAALPGGLGEVVDLSDACTDLQWDRKASTTTVATASLAKRAGKAQPTIAGGPVAADCCARIAQLATVEQEIEIRRGGDVVWAGPLGVIDEGTNDVKLKAADESVWIRDWRTVPTSYTALTAASDGKTPILDLNDVWHAVASLALASGPTGLSLTPGAPVGVPALRAVLPGKRMAGSDIDEMTRTGRPWTMLGRGLTLDAADLDPIDLSEDDFLAELRVIESGEQWGSRIWLNGNGDVQAVWGGANSRGIVKDIVITETTIMDKVSAMNAAQRRWAAGGGDVPVPMVVVPDGSQLALTAGVDVADLVPGRPINVRLASYCTARVSLASFALVDVSVKVSGGTGAASETFAVSLSQNIDDTGTEGTTV